MWTRKELKTRGKEAFKANYLKAVVVALILTFVAGGAGAASGSSVSNNINHQINNSEEVKVPTSEEELEQSLSSILESQGINMQDENTRKAMMAVFFFFIGAMAVAMVIGTIIKILIINPLYVGCQGFFLKNLDSPAGFGAIGTGFNPWLRNVGSVFLTDLFLTLWTCLFIIPGIIKAYSYRMVPYILADDPSIGAIEAITKSRQMMKGNKWRAFVLDLSFIGWHILGLITLGIVELFYVAPYELSTDAALYEAIK